MANVALQQEVKAGMTHSICRLNVWVAGKCVRSIANTCHT